MKSRLIPLSALSTVLFSMAITAHAEVSVKDPWVRATVAEQKATGAFMQLTAKSDTRLIEARSTVAGAVEVHEMTMDNNVMRMRAVPNGVDLPAGKTVELKPGSYHIMLLDLHHGLKTGETVPLTLVVEGKDKTRETIDIKATVRAMAGAPGAPKASMGDEAHQHHHH
ncbi:MAG: copper chaperone PCu(A)C [Leptothrix ochracea]|uniref:copper chaperone PCu(A)C n=1 Tax=Leptothrix ochracea TaxID=735331 RepID=UPI0034E21873